VGSRTKDAQIWFTVEYSDGDRGDFKEEQIRSMMKVADKAPVLESVSIVVGSDTRSISRSGTSSDSSGGSGSGSSDGAGGGGGGGSGSGGSRSDGNSSDGSRKRTLRPARTVASERTKRQRGSHTIAKHGAEFEFQSRTTFPGWVLDLGNQEFKKDVPALAMFHHSSNEILPDTDTLPTLASLLKPPLS
jgi:hypothetical protein